MTLHYATQINEGEQKVDGSYVITRADLTICETCLIEKGWGHTIVSEDVPGESCELCGTAG